MRIVIALGGNALLRRGEAHSPARLQHRVVLAAAQIARTVRHAEAAAGGATVELLITHGNGPQIGALALQAAASGQPAAPLDVLGAQTQGQIGYLLEQALANRLPGRLVATLVTRTEVSAQDPAFAAPDKPIGPVYSPEEAERIAHDTGWAFAGDGSGRGPGRRRVVPSPAPLRVLNVAAIHTLLAAGAVVIAAGGGGVPVLRRRVPLHPGCEGVFQGVEAVIDKDASSALLACELGAQCLLIATDVPALYADWGLPTQQALQASTPEALEQRVWTAGSMAPKVRAACHFVRRSGGRAVIGALQDIEAMLAGHAGTQIRPAEPAQP